MTLHRSCCLNITPQEYARKNSWTWDEIVHAASQGLPAAAVELLTDQAARDLLVWCQAMLTRQMKQDFEKARDNLETLLQSIPEDPAPPARN